LKLKKFLFVILIFNPGLLSDYKEVRLRKQSDLKMDGVRKKERKKERKSNERLNNAEWGLHISGKR